MEVKHISVIIERLVPGAKHNGNIAIDTREAYEKEAPYLINDFEWLDERDKPTWAEITAEFYVYCSELGCRLCPDCCVWNDVTKEFEHNVTVWLVEVVKPERKRLMDAFDWRILRYERQVRLEEVPVDDITVLDAYMVAVHTLPDNLTEIDGNLQWPDVPE